MLEAIAVTISRIVHTVAYHGRGFVLHNRPPGLRPNQTEADSLEMSFYGDSFGSTHFIWSGSLGIAYDLRRVAR